MGWADHPQSCEGFLYILQPAVVFAARVNLAAASYPLAAIPYDGVTTGTLADVKMGMTVLIGSTAGGWDRGRTVVRGAANDFGDVGDASVLNIGYASRGHGAGEVDLVDDSYLTVLDLVEVWQRKSRMLDDGTLYKDYDWTVESSPPLAGVADGTNPGGLARIDFVDGSGVLALDFDSGASQATAAGASVDTTTWDVGDGTITGGGADTDAAISVEFDPGVRWVRLAVVDDAGVQAQPRCQLVVSLDGEDDADLVQTVQSASWRRVPEGCSFTAVLRERLDPADYVPGTVVLFLTRQIDGLGSATLVLAFAGYLDYQQSFGQANALDFERGTTLYAVDAALRLAGMRGFPSAIERESSPAHHNQIANADLEAYALWLLYHHTTALMVADYVPGGTDYPFSRFGQAGGSLYQCADGVAWAMAHRLTMDGAGVLRVVPDPLRLESGDRTSTVFQDIQPEDIVRIDRIGRSRRQQAALHGQAYGTTTTDAADLAGDLTPWYGVAPGTVEGEGGSSESWQGVGLAASELELWQRLGQDHARAASSEDAIRIQLAHGLDGGIEPALMAWVTVTTDADTVGWGDEALSSERCLVTALQVDYDAEDNALRQSIEVERETVGAPGTYDPQPVLTQPGIISDPVLAPPNPGGGTGLYRDVPDLYAFDATAGVVWHWRKATATWESAIDLAALGMDGTLLGATWRVGGNIARILTSTEVRRLNNYSSGTPALGTAHSFAEAALRRQFNFERGEVDFGIVVTYIPGTGVRVDYTSDDGSWTRPSLGAVFNNYDTNLSNSPRPGIWIDPHVAGHALISIFTNTGGLSSGLTSAVYETFDHGASWSALASPSVPMGGWLANMLVVAYLDTAMASIFHGYTSDSGGTVYFDLYKNDAQISPTYGGAEYGYIRPLRCLSIADDDAHSVIAIGAPTSTEATRGIWLSRDGGTSWTRLAGPSDSVRARQVYFVDRNTAYLIGDSGSVALFDGNSLIDLSIPGGGSLVALMGP